MVLLKNDSNALPLDETVKTLLVIGPNARGRVVSGGGSAALKPSYVVTPYDGIVHSSKTEVKYSLGCYAHKYLPTLENNLTTFDGQEGWMCTFYTHDQLGQPDKNVFECVLTDTRIKLNDFLPEGLTPTWSIKLAGRLTVDSTGPFELGLTVAGRAKLFVNKQLAIDNWTKQTPGDFFYGQGTIEEKTVVHLKANVPVDVLVEYTNTPPPDTVYGDLSQPALMRGVRLGGAAEIEPTKAIEDAVKLAKQVDAVVIIAGLNPEWEAEGFDRPTLQLPGRQDELISRVSKANKRTIVTIQAGSAVAMPWVNEVPTVLYSWYQGNETGNAIADVLFGKVNPSGRLPLTFPVLLEDIPAYPNTTSENGKIYYHEDVFVGYKHYQMRGVRPLFPFGHGLSYTTFDLSDLVVSEPKLSDEDLTVKVSVAVRNTGPVVGTEVIQVYVGLPDIGIATPKLQLRGFSKAHNIATGEARHVSITLDKYACAFWDERTSRWRSRAGTYSLFVGRSSYDLPLESKFELKRDYAWAGL